MVNPSCTPRPPALPYSHQCFQVLEPILDLIFGSLLQNYPDSGWHPCAWACCLNVEFYCLWSPDSHFFLEITLTRFPFGESHPLIFSVSPGGYCEYCMLFSKRLQTIRALHSLNSSAPVIVSEMVYVPSRGNATCFPLHSCV